MKMLTLLGIFIFGVSAHAINGRTTYQAKIIKPDGYPLEASSVNFRFTILDPAASCILYVEDYAAVNMSGGGGLISFTLGAGARSFPVSGTSSTFSNVFDNSAAFLNCQPTGTYNPTSTDARKIVMQFQDSSGWQTLPAMAINAVPYAMYAGKSENAAQLNGKADTAFVENATLAALNCNAATHAITFNGVSFSCIAVGSGGGGITSVTTSGTVLTTGGTASAPVISITAATMSQDGYLTSLDYAEFKAKLAASSTQIINTLGYAPVSSSAVATQINNSNLSGDVSGTVSSNSVISVGGKTSSQISTSIDDTLAATASSTADTIVKRNSSGNFTANDIYANAAKINYVDIYKPSTSFNIRLQAPTSLSTNYVLNLPTTSGTTGQVLSTDGAGNLSWINPSTGSVVSVSATAPLASTGGATPTISITQATSSTDGYLSSTDFNTFNNKQAATSAAIIATLGYTPADNAASGTYAQKANNLSDLASVATARTNLGLGTFATASSIDLGSASATGTLAIARLPSFGGDATIAAASNTIVFSNSGVTAGTYTKIIVDAKGRVTSSSALASSDVTTALGYTPANSSSGVTSLNGSVSQTQTFAIANTGTTFGITTANGVHTFAIPLAASSSVVGGLLSNADYTTFTNKQNATSAAIIATLGYTPANATSATQWTTNGSNIYYNTGNIGVGTTAPSAPLHIPTKSASTTGSSVIIGDDIAMSTVASRARLQMGNTAGNSEFLIGQDATHGLLFNWTYNATVANAYGVLETFGGNNPLVLQSVGGNVGIGTTTPTAKLDVAGQAWFGVTNKLKLQESGDALSLQGALATDDNQKKSLLLNAWGGNVGIGTTSPAYLLTVNGATSNPVDPMFKVINSRTPATADWVNGFELNAPNLVNNSYLYFSLGKAASTNNRAAIQYTHAADGSSSNRMEFGFYGASSLLNILASGNVGVGTSSPSAKLHLVAGTSSTASFKLTSGTLLTSPQSGTMEYDGSQFYLTDGANTRRTIATGSSAGTIDNASTINSTGNMSLVPVGSVVVSSTTASTNSQTGALIVKGGMGVAGDIYTSGTIVTSSNIQGVSVTATSGMITPYLYGSTVSGGSLYIDSTTHASKGNILLAPNGGNVGIGTTTPTAALSVTSTVGLIGSFTSTSASNSQLDFNSSTGKNTNIAFQNTGVDKWYVGNDSSNDRFRLHDGVSEVFTVLRSSGNVGIGTTSPSQKLDVFGNQVLHVSATDDQLVLNPLVAGSGANLYVTNSAGNAYRPLNMQASMFSFTNGNVGIGTTAPVEKLQVNGNIRLQDNETNATAKTGRFLLGHYTNAEEPVYVLGSATDASNNYIALGGGNSSYNAATQIDFFTASNNTTTTGTSRMTILLTGNVGIGTTSPASKLDVNGLVISSGFSFNGSEVGADTGLFEANDGLLQLKSNGAVVLHTKRGDNEGGYVGIGTTNPTEKLEVSGAIKIPGVGQIGPNGVYGYAVYQNGTNNFMGQMYGIASGVQFTDSGGANTVTIKDGGNVGIGTTSPSVKTHITGSNNGPLELLRLENSDAGGRQSVIGFKNTGLTNPTTKIYGGGVSAGGDGTFKVTITNPSGTEQNVIEATNSSGTDPKLVFSTAGSERLRIDNVGNVGVGTTTPGEKFDVFGNMRIGSSDSNYIAFRGTTGDGAGSYNHTYIGERFYAAGESSELLLFKGNDSDNASGPDRIRLAGGNILFDTYATPDAPSGTFEAVATSPMITTKMIIKGNGDVGIGTTNPSYTLDVSGTLRVTGQAYTNTGNGSFSILSDVRYKDVHGAFDRGLDAVLNIDIIKFNYKKDNPLGSDSSHEYVGVSAQNLQQVIPEAVEPRKVGKEEYLTINTSPVLWTLINAVKQLYTQVMERFEGHDRQIASIVESKADKAEIEVLKQKAAKVDKLEAENAAKAKEIDALKSYLCSKDPAASICK